MEKHYDQHEPSEEEWNQIEELITREGQEENEKGQDEDRQELEVFKDWLNKNGMSWNIKNTLNSEEKKHN